MKCWVSNKKNPSSGGAALLETYLGISQVPQQGSTNKIKMGHHYSCWAISSRPPRSMQYRVGPPDLAFQVGPSASRFSGGGPRIPGSPANVVCLLGWIHAGEQRFSVAKRRSHNNFWALAPGLPDLKPRAAKAGEKKECARLRGLKASPTHECVGSHLKPKTVGSHLNPKPRTPSVTILRKSVNIPLRNRPERRGPPR